MVLNSSYDASTDSFLIRLAIFDNAGNPLINEYSGVPVNVSSDTLVDFEFRYDALTNKPVCVVINNFKINWLGNQPLLLAILSQFFEIKDPNEILPLLSPHI